MYSSIRGSPAIGEDGTIYIGTSGGIMFAMNPSGILKWQFVTHSGQFTYSSPSIGPDGTIYIGSASSDFSLYAFTSIGSLKWQFVSANQIFASPSITPDGNIVFNLYSSNYVYCISPSASLIWQVSMTSSSQYTSPVIGADGMIYLASDSLYAFYSTGSLRWKSLINIYPQNPVIFNTEVLYAASGSSIYSIGAPITTLSPSEVPWQGLQIGSASPKFGGNIDNTVI
jgi:outer membrane protein assembly factor BamB